MNLLKFTQAMIDGEGKLIPLGRVYVKADTIVGFFSLVNDKKVMKDGCQLMTAQAGFTVMEDVDEVREVLEQSSWTRPERED